MGDLIHLHQRRRRPARGAPGPAELFFDLASPSTYLAAERADRALAAVRWTPVAAALVYAPRGGCELARVRGEAAERAAALRLPLAWPERWPAPVPAAMRVAGFAAERGRGSAFVLAATRLAFGGGYDLDDPEMLAEAVAAAGLDPDDARRAALDRGRDVAAQRAGQWLRAAGVDRLPALRVGSALFSGEARLGEAVAAARAAAGA